MVRLLLSEQQLQKNKNKKNTIALRNYSVSKCKLTGLCHKVEIKPPEETTGLFGHILPLFSTRVTVLALIV